MGRPGFELSGRATNMKGKSPSFFSKIFIVAFLLAAALLQLQKLYWSKATIGIHDYELRVLLAEDLYEHKKGLGDRDSLVPYDGMLFIFGRSFKISIVMRDMRFPIDIIWFSDGEIVDIAKNVQVQPGAQEKELHRYRPRVNADMVLELPAGRADFFGLSLGDRMRMLDV